MKVAAAVVLKSVILIAAFAATRQYNNLYSSPQCAMRLVNESDPGAYSRHPYWKDLRYDESCAGDALEQYVRNQYENGEKWYLEKEVNAWTIIGVCLALYGLFQSRRNIISILPLTIVAYFAGIIVLMHTHFEVDITFMCGGILHHARAEKPGIDYKNNSVTEGYLYCGGLNRLLYVSVIYWLINRNDRLKKYYSPFLAMGLMQLFVLMALTVVGKRHPLYHIMAINGSTPEMDNAWPYTFAWQAYKHCIVHHDNGLSFSGDLFLDPVWDAFLYAFAFIHNALLKVELGSFGHFLVSTVGDMAMGLVGVGIIYLVLHLGVSIIPKSSSNKTTLAKKQK